MAKLKSYWIKVGPDPMTSDFIRRGNVGACPDTQKVECHVKMKAATGVMLPSQGKEPQGLGATTRSWVEGMKDSFLEPFEILWPCGCLISDCCSPEL